MPLHNSGGHCSHCVLGSAHPWPGHRPQTFCGAERLGRGDGRCLPVRRGSFVGDRAALHLPHRLGTARRERGWAGGSGEWLEESGYLCSVETFMSPGG